MIRPVSLDCAHSSHLHSHGRLFLFNIMVTSNWRAKLSEYALDSYLKLTRGGLGEAGGYDLLPSEQHPANTVLFISPEKCSGKMAAAVQSQRPPTTTRPIAPRRGWAGGLRRRISQSARASEHSAVEPIAPPDTQPDEAAMESTKWLGEQRADVWAFGCVLVTLALHHNRAKERSLHTAPGLAHATPAAVRRRAEDDMYGWDEHTSVSKDRPGRCSRLMHAAEAEAAEDRPCGPRTRGADLRLKAVGELASHLKRSRVSSGASRPDHGESSSGEPEADALASAPPSPPVSPADSGESVLGVARLDENSVKERSLERPRAEVSEAVNSRLNAAVDSQLPVTIDPALHRAERGMTPETPDHTLPRAITSRRLKVEQSRLPALGAQPANANHRYVFYLRLCQDKVSPLDGVTPSCGPRPMLQLATQCCARDPEERPSLAAVLEQLHGNVLRSIDAAAYSAGVGAQRPVPALEGWRDAAERAFPFCTEPAAGDEGGGALGPAATHGPTAGADHSRKASMCSDENPATCGNTSSHDAGVVHCADHRNTTRRATFAPLPHGLPQPMPHLQR